MWRWVVRLLRSIWGGPRRAENPPQFIPPQLLADLQRLIDDELSLRKRKQRADRYQRAGATSGAALLGSLVILLLMTGDLSKKEVIPTSGDSPILLATLAVTGLATLWNVLGWLGGRDAVPFVS